MSCNSDITAFLSQHRIAVAGMSRSGNAPANAIAKRLRTAGHVVFGVNPRATSIDGEPCYANLASIPGGVGAVMIATPTDATADIIRQCIALHIRTVWMHRSVSGGSVDETAVDLAREHGITCIVGGCPLMFVEPVDPFHGFMRWWLQKTGRVPK